MKLSKLMEYGYKILGEREKFSTTGFKTEILVLDEGKDIKQIYLCSKDEDIALSASLTSKEYILREKEIFKKNLQVPHSLLFGDEGTPALRGHNGNFSNGGNSVVLTEEEADWIRTLIGRRKKLFSSEKDLETGITYYVLNKQLSPEEWIKVSHLFIKDAELDCPESRDWNDSITLPWSTREPGDVENILKTGWDC